MLSYYFSFVRDEYPGSGPNKSGGAAWIQSIFRRAGSLFVFLRLSDRRACRRLGAHWRGEPALRATRNAMVAEMAKRRVQKKTKVLDIMDLLASISGGSKASEPREILDEDSTNDRSPLYGA